MRDLFVVNGVVAPPYLVTGNKMRFETASKLLEFLFLWDDGKARRGWESRPYRMILQKSFNLVKGRLGQRKADCWLHEHLHLVQLTHWILPYPSDTALITLSKTNHQQGMTGRLMWFSAVYANPERVSLPFESQPKTIYSLIWRGFRQNGGQGDYRDYSWGTAALIKACQEQEIQVFGEPGADKHWIIGRTSIGAKGFKPVWERSHVPKLQMLEQIRGMSLNELEDVMLALAVEHVQVGDSNTRSSVVSVSGSSTAGHPHRTVSLRDVFTRTHSDYSTDSGSVFQPGPSSE
jgi:hypothetical protein